MINSIENNLNLIRVKDRIFKDSEIPILSVFCWSFNDIENIKECIESILEQKTSFPIEIIIHDDASTDGTQFLLKEYELKYPNVFNNILNATNQWSLGNGVMSPILKHPRGEFIALMHADDYWIDDNKLQKQVQFLIENKIFSMYFHKINYLIDGTVSGSYYKTPNSNILKLNDIILEHYIPTSSLVFNKRFLPIHNKLYYKKYFNDIFLEIMISLNGPVFYSEEIMGIYRKNTSSISHNIEHQDKGRNQLILIYLNLLLIVPITSKLHVIYKLMYNILGKIYDKLKLIILKT